MLTLRKSVFAKLFTLLILLVSLAISLLAVSIYVGPVRDRILNEVLAPYGIQNLHSELDSITLHSLSLNSVSMSVRQVGSETQLDLAGLRLEKLESELPWHHTRSWSLVINHLAVDLQGVAAEADLAVESAAGSEITRFNPADWLPQKILAKIPMGKMHCEQMSLRYQPLEGDAWALSGSLMLMPEVAETTLTIAHQQQTFPGKLKLTPENVYVSIGIQDKPWVKLDTRLDLIDQQFVAGGVLSIQDIQELDDWIKLVSQEKFHSYGMKGDINAAYSLNLSEGTLNQWLASTESPNWYDGLTLNAHLTTDMQIEGDKVLFKRGAIVSSARVQLEGGNLKLTPIELKTLSMYLNAANDKIHSAAKNLVGTADKLLVEASAIGELSANVKGDEIILSVNEGIIALGESRAQLYSRIDLKALSARLSDRKLQSIKGVSKVDLVLLDKPALKGLAKLNADLVEDTMIGELKATLEDLTSVVTEFEYHTSTQLVDFTVNSERATLATETFNNWAEKLSLPLALELGDIELSMQGQVDLNNLQGLSTAGNVLVAGWQGDLEKNHFSSLDSPFKFSGDLSQFTVEAEVTNGLFDIGIPVTDIHYYVTLQGSLINEDFTLSLKNLEGNLVGGTVRIPSIEWDSRVQTTQFNVVISDWQFSEMIKLLERDDLVVSGTLDGMLPILIEKEGVLIENGLLTAREPGGVIKYTPDSAVKSMLSDQQELKMAADILENFEYEQLDVVLNQDIEFNQSLALTLKGKNPRVYGGTPVNLNLNIDHNILPLIQSLTLPGKVQEHWNELDKLQP